MLEKDDEEKVKSRRMKDNSLRGGEEEEEDYQQLQEGPRVCTYTYKKMNWRRLWRSI